MKQGIVLLMLVLAAMACGKGKFETTPQLKIKSVNPENKQLAFNQPLAITFQFTDKEGDVSDSFLIIRERLNARDPNYRLLPYPLPNYPRTIKGEIDVKLDFQNQVILDLNPIRIPGSEPSKNENDTLRFKFVARDKGGHYSDTAVLDNLIVERL